MEELFPTVNIPVVLENLIKGLNPWWYNKPGPGNPQFRRWAYSILEKRLISRLAPAVIIRGPRQVGKTTIQNQFIESLIKEQEIDPRRILKVQFEELSSLPGVKLPIIEIVKWYEKNILKKTLNECAREGQMAYIFFDEIQNLNNWAEQLKLLIDNNTANYVVTGSSALRIGLGHDSLAGRVSTIELGPLNLVEIAELRSIGKISSFFPENGLSPLLRKEFWLELFNYGIKNKAIRDETFRFFSSKGRYPIAHAKQDVEWPVIADQLNENIVKRVIQHDLRIGEKGRKRDQNLLEEVFRLICRYIGMSPNPAEFAREARRALHSNIGPQRITYYMKFLEDTLLVKLIRPLEIRLKKKKGYSKLCLCDHALRASWLEEVIPISPEELEKNPHLNDLAGHIAESVAGYFLSGISGLDIAHFPARPNEPEIDFIVTVGEKRIPVEIKYGSRIDPLRDTEGLRTFLEKTVYNAPFGILITRNDNIKVDDPRIMSLPLSSLLLLK